MPNYIYANTHHLIHISLSISSIILSAYNIVSIVRYCNNGLSVHNFPVDVMKLQKFSLFKLDNIVMKTLEATTQLFGFNQCLPMRQSNQRLTYRGPHQHKYDVIDTLFYSVVIHNDTTSVELIVGTKILITDVYVI